MKWFIIVLMMGVHDDGGKDVFWYQKPEFQSFDQCRDFVTYNAMNIKMQMQSEFGLQPIENVFCVREDKTQYFGVPTPA